MNVCGRERRSGGERERRIRACTDRGIHLNYSLMEGVRERQRKGGVEGEREIGRALRADRDCNAINTNTAR